MPSREERRWKYFEENKTLRNSRKPVKPNRKPKKVRRKDWMEYASADPDILDEVDQADFLQDERIMPRGERERRQAARPAIVAEPTEQEELAGKEPLVGVAGQQGMVIEVSTGLCRVALGARTLLCPPAWLTFVIRIRFHQRRGSRAIRFLVSDTEEERGVVEEVLPRKSALVRQDVGQSPLTASHRCQCGSGAHRRGLAESPASGSN